MPRPLTAKRALPFLLAVSLSACSWSIGRAIAPSSSPTVSQKPITNAAPGEISSPTPVTPIPTLSLDDPANLAEELVAVETAIRSERTRDRRLPELGRRQQEAYRLLTAHPNWLPMILSQAPPEVGGAIRANVGAALELRALNEPVPTLPPWRIVTPPPAEELLDYYREADSRFGVPWAYLAAIHLVESGMGRVQGTSTAGAQGPMQFLPGTWAQYGQGDINDPHDAILAAARYLRAAGAPTDMPRALYAYNHSQRYVRAVSLYAEQMAANERAYFGYYHWRIYVQTTRGEVLLEEGYGR